MKQIVDRFWQKVDKRSDNECWEWTDHINSDGYGRMRINNKMMRAHRISWLIHFGKIPDGLLICHKCDNRRCVNPSHLFSGTQKDNIQDMIYKQRKSKISSTGNALIIKYGENNPRSRLTWKEIRKIRELYSTGKYSQTQLAKIFKITQSNVSRIIRNQIWAT